MCYSYVKIVIWSGHNFAYATDAELLWQEIVHQVG